MTPSAQEEGNNAALAYVGLTSLIFLILFFKNSVSFRVTSVESGMALGVFFLIFIMSFILYYRLRYSDPGYLNSRNAAALNMLKDSSSDDETDTHNKDEYCTICQITKPLRTRHCRRCSRCVARFDHHCFWIGNCVGEKNHRTFFFYIVLESIVLSWAIYDAVNTIEPQTSWPLFFYQNSSLLACIWCTTGFGSLCYALLVYQIFLLLTNQTSWEHMKRNEVYYLKTVADGELAFHRGICGNLYEFFWESRYPFPREFQFRQDSKGNLNTSCLTDCCC